MSEPASPQISWSDLPLEIRLGILEMVAQSHTRKLDRRGLSVASLTTVCAEWRTFFERITFGRLTLESSSIRRFHNCVVGRGKGARLGYIRHLWLRIRLYGYGCQVCRTPETLHDIHWYTFTSH